MSNFSPYEGVHFGFVDGLVPPDEATGDTAMHVQLVDGGEREFAGRQNGMPPVGSCVKVVEAADPDGSFYQSVEQV